MKLWELQGNSDNFPFGYWMEGREGRRNQGYIVDTVQLARLIDVLTGKKRARYNLGSLVKNFDITKATAHRADGDVKMTKELYEKIKTVLKDPVIAAFNDCY